MKTITIAGHKGGLGKTTLCVILAHALSLQGKKVVFADLDPQKSLTTWWNEREGEHPVSLADVEYTALDEAKITLGETFDYWFIDTPPSHRGVIKSAIDVADLVIMPCTPSSWDFDGVGETISVVENAEKPFFFAVNRANLVTKMAKQTVPMLAQYGKVAPRPIVQRTDYTAGFMGGTTPLDFDNPAIKEEVGDLVAYLIKQLGKLK